MQLRELLTEVERLLPIARELSTAEERLRAVSEELAVVQQRTALAGIEAQQAAADSRRKVRELDEHHDTRLAALNKIYGDKRAELQKEFDAFRMTTEGTMKRLLKQVEEKEGVLGDLTEKVDAVTKEFNEIQSKLAAARKAFKVALTGDV